jgi:hypothetical protein
VTDSQSKLGPVVSVIGAALLALSVFMPWYSLTITSTGAALAQQELNGVAQQYGNAKLQDTANTVGAQFTALAGHQLGTVSAHQVLKTISVLLLILAALAFLGSLVWLAELDVPIEVDPKQVAAIGGISLLFVLYRLAEHPGPSVAVFTLSLSWGIWLALASSVAIVGGALATTQR